MRLTLITVLMLAGGTHYMLWAGKDGLVDLWRLQRAVEETRDENVHLRERNQALTAEVIDLKTGEQAMEERARSGLGMVKAGETFFQVIDEE